jgi:hypothetical protein
MILGTDISHYQDDPATTKTIDFEKMHMAGAEFCILKASQATWIDHIYLRSEERRVGKECTG